MTSRARTTAVQLRVLLRRFWPYTVGLRAKMVALAGLILLAPVLSAITIWLFKLLIDDVLVPQRFDALPALALAYTVVTMSSGLVSFLDRSLSASLGEDVLLRVRSAMFAHLHSLAPVDLERSRPGDLLARLTADVTAIEDIVLDGGAQALSYTTQIVVFVAAMLVLDWRLTVLALVAAPCLLALARIISTRLRRRSRERRDHVGAMTAVAEESIAHAAAIRVFHRAADEQERFDIEQRAARRATMSAIRLQAAVAPLTDLLQVLGVLTVAAVAVHQLATGTKTLGGILVFVGYLSQLYGPVQSFGDLTTSLYSAAAGAERVAELLDMPGRLPEPASTEVATPCPVRRGRVELRGVSVRYAGSDRPALDDLTVCIPAGAHVAVVGPSGAGKSTFVAALLRLLDPDEREILLDGADLRSIRSPDLRRQVVAALQEPAIPDTSISDIVSWGDPDAGIRRVREAARAADVDAFVLGLPDGYATRAGTRGGALSGGQRQRLSLARAILADAAVLVVDEPTTGLDADTAGRVLARLTDVRRDRTTILVTHDPLVVAHADLALELVEGRGALRPNAARLRTRDRVDCSTSIAAWAAP